MFLQLAANQQQADNLFESSPAWIIALAEHYWYYRIDNAIPALNNGVNNRIGWALPAMQRIATDYNMPLPAGSLPGGLFSHLWDHIVYAWAIENTRIYDIFFKVLKAYRSGDTLGKPRYSRRFWDTTERLFFSLPPTTTVWRVTSDVRPDETSLRRSIYSRMLGLSVAPAAEVAQPRPHQKPAAANAEFIPSFESFAREVWRGIINRQNQTGRNDTDNSAIASEAQNIHHMLANYRTNGNLSFEEFRFTAMMSWFHLAVLFNTSVVLDLRADASSPEQRLCNIAERVGMAPHPKARALFALAQPFSTLLRWIEAGLGDLPAGAQQLYMNANLLGIAQAVIGQYSQAMGLDLKAAPVSVSPPTPSPDRQLAPPQRLQLVGANQQAGSPAPATAQSP